MDIRSHLDEKAESESVADEWKALARILDRFFIVVFLFAQVVSTFAIMLRIIL